MKFFNGKKKKIDLNIEFYCVVYLDVLNYIVLI